MITINCDIGERGVAHPIDCQLMRYIDIANIACGGHAGDRESTRAFRQLSEKLSVIVSAHLSYPDRAGFGRVSLDIPIKDLLSSLDLQYRLMPGVDTVKLHGALYNDSCRHLNIAMPVTEWFLTKKISTVITMCPSELSITCVQAGIHVLAEAFAERRYQYLPERKQLILVSRSKEHASIRDCDEAVAHTRGLAQDGKVSATIEHDNGPASTEWVQTTVDTICIHSDSRISLELARRIATEKATWKT